MKRFQKLGADPRKFLEDIDRQRLSDVNEIADMQRLLGVAKRVSVNATAVGNVGVGEDDLMTYTLPAAMLANDHERLEFEAAFEFAANGNNKRVRAYLDSTLLWDSTAVAQNDGDIVVNVTLIRTASNAQRGAVKVLSSANLIASTGVYFTATEDLTAATVFKFTGEATATNDIVQRYLTANWWPGG